MQRKYLVLSLAERLDLIKEYEDDAIYTKIHRAAKDAIYEEEKAAAAATAAGIATKKPLSPSEEKKIEVPPERPLARPLSAMIGALHDDHGYSLPSKADRKSDKMSFVTDVVRGIQINKKQWHTLEEFKEIAVSGYTEQDKKPFIGKFIKDSWNLSDDESKEIMESLENFHHQSLVPSVFSIALTYAIVNKDSSLPLNVKLDYTGNYTRSTDKVIHFESQAQYKLKAENDIIFDIPGTINCDYTLTSRGFLPSKDTPRFSNTLLKTISLAPMSTLHLSAEAIELTKAEEELRKLFADKRLEKLPATFISPSRSELEDQFPNVTIAHAVLNTIEANLPRLLQDNNTKDLKIQTQAIKNITVALTADLKTLPSTESLKVQTQEVKEITPALTVDVKSPTNSETKTTAGGTTQYLFALAQSGLYAGIKLFSYPFKPAEQQPKSPGNNSKKELSHTNDVDSVDKGSIELSDFKSKDKNSSPPSPSSKR